MPNKYFIDNNNRLKLIPSNRVSAYLKKYPNSREATTKELSHFENKRAENNELTQRKSNIQNNQGGSPTNQPLIGQNTSFAPSQFNLNIPNYAEEFAKNKPELSLRQPDNTPTKIFSGNSPFARPSKDGVIADAMKKAQDNRRQDADYIIQSAINEYDSYKKWIDEVNRDPEMSENVKKDLNVWYNQNFKDTSNPTDGVRIPSPVRDYLENNKQTVPTSVWAQGSSMFGGGSYAQGTKQENTPEQMAMIANFLANSPKGRMIMEDEKLYLKRLDDNIDNLEKEMKETSSKRRELTPKNIGMKNYLMMSKWKKEEFNKEREAIRADIEKQYPFGDLMNSQNQLNELKKLREAYKDGDKGAIKQLLKEFGRRLPYDLANAGSFGAIGLTDASALSSTLENPKNVLTRKGYNLVNEYQQAHELDRSIAQDIARGTTQTLPFISQFVATGGITSAAGKGLLAGASKIGLNAEKLATIGSGIDKTTRLGKGLSKTGNIGRVVATDVLDAGARSLIMPNTYADAYARSIDNPGSYLDNLTHSWFVNTIENYSEKFGTHLPGIGAKSPKLKKIMDQTGIQGFPEEFAEEQLGTILNAAFNTGEAEWSDLVDPRNQLITAGTIGLLQVPYASVGAGGYAAGKYRDIKQKRSIRKGFNSNLANMNNVFGEESEALISTINQIIESDNSEGVGINSFMVNVASDTELTDKEKDAVFKYTMSYVPYSALNQSKQEQVQEVEQQVTQAIEENANPEMGAVVSATIAGVESPMQVVSGNISQREDGSIDREASDKQIFYVDAEGNKQVTSIDFVESVEENIPTQDAIAQLTEAETANIISQQENEEVREYTPGEIVTADAYGNGIPFTGQITEVTEDGKYILVGTQSGQQVTVEPRQIINQDNVQDVDNGSLVQYRNEKGEIVQGTVNDAYGLRPQGMIDIDGNVIPIADVIGLVDETQEEATNNQEAGETISFWHGGLPAGFSIDNLDVLRPAEKQQKKGRNYAGFYMYDETSRNGAETYSQQTGRDLFRFDISPIANILELDNIERVSQDKLKEYAEQGYDLLKGKDVRGRIEYILLNKDVVSNVENESKANTENNEQSAITSLSKQNILTLDQIPKDEKGNILFDQVSVENTISALGEVYDISDIPSVVDATIANIEKQVDKVKSPKPTGDITKDIANKRTANEQAEVLSNRLAYWQDVRNAIQESKSIEQRVSEQLMGEETPTIKLDNNKKPKTVNGNTPFQRRLNAVEKNVHTVRDRILFGIASGAYKFRWKDKGVSMGLARELGLSGSEAERKARIGLLSNNGHTPSTLAHRIWEETGGELNDNDIRSEVIDVLNSVSSRKQALEVLENNAGITEEQFQQQQTEASEYELQLRAEVEARYNEILSQQIEEDLVSLRDEAVSLGATLEQVEDVRTPSDFIDLIEQLQDGQQEQASDRAGSNEQTEDVEDEGSNDQRTQRTVGERNRSEESTGDSKQDSDSTGNGINLFPEEQRVVNEATAEIDAAIAEAQKELTTQQKELSSARKRLGKAQADTQGSLFGNEQQSTLFDVPADLSKENAVDNILTPIQQQIDAVQTNLDNLTNSRDARIQEALENYRKQGNLLDEIARAEAETDTNPTESQKEAGNYKKGKVTIQGFNISIEQPQGSVRSGVDANGKEWSITMNNTYGYIRGTEGKDSDHIDVFLGNNPESNRVFVVDQVNQDGSFDEHKVMLGFDSVEEARDAYLSNYEEGWQGLGNITEVDVDVFRKWSKSDTRRIKPFAEYKEIQQASYIPYSFSQEMIDFNREHGANILPLNDNATVSFEVFTENGKPYVGAAVEGHETPFKIKDGFESTTEAEEYLINRTDEIDNLWWDMQDILENKEVSTPAYGVSNTLISSEKYEELRKQMRGKLNNLNSGFDPELFTIGTQMAMYHIEAGARKFADFANRMIEDLGNNVRPYLKSFYEGARQVPSMETLRNEMDSFKTVDTFDVQNLSTFEEESNTPNINSNETNSDNRSDNSIAENGGISTRATDTDVRERTASTQTDGRTQSQQRPAMETESVEQRGRSDRDRGNNTEPSGTELRARGTERNADNRRKDTGDTEHSGKPLNTNNNKQSREENVVPRGNTAKINANIAAIKLAKRLTETGKKATPEQMSVLRRYTGWGGLSSVFQANDKNYKALQDLLTDEEYDSARASTTTAFYTPPEITSSVWDMIEKLGFKGGNILEPSAGIGNFFALMPENISNISKLRGIELDTVSGNVLKLLYPDANINVSGFEKQRIANNSMDLVVSNVPFGNFKVYDSNNKDISTQFDIHDYFIAKSIRALKAGGIGVFITTSSTLDKSSALRNWVINNGNADFIDAVRLNTDTFKNDAGTEATADIIIVRKRDVRGISPYAKNMQDSVMSREETYNIQEKNQWGYNAGEVEKKARMVYNKYFLDNPTRMAGEMKFGFEGGNAIRPTEQRLAPVGTIKQQEVIDQMIADLPSNIYNPVPAQEASQSVANNGTKEGGLTVIDGQAYIVQYGEATPVDWNSNKAAGYPKEEVLQDYLDIKNTINELLEAESSTDNELVYINKTRTKLNKTYDKFVNKYGSLNENRKINFLQDDVDFTSVSAIENVEDGKDGEKTIFKSDIFSKRVIDNQIEPKADNVEDAVRVSINQNGKVDIPYIAKLLSKTNAEVQSDIVSKRIGFVNPETGLVESRNQYLSGNVRDKLSIAQQANQENENESNIEELSKVIPADIPINLIKLTLGSTWVPINVYEDFFKETFDVGAQFTRTSTDKYIGKFSHKDNAKDVQMGMPEASGSTLALNAMNNATTTISMQVWEDGKRKSVTDPLKTAQAAAKQSEVAETFEAWVKQNKKYHEELENIYNNTFNAVINSTVDVDSFDRFPGVGGKVVSLGSKELENRKELHQYRVAKENTEADNELVAKEAKSLGLDYNAESGVYSTTNRGNADTFAKKLNGTSKILRQHQKEGVIRGLESATLLAHEVGTGKTLTLITTAMEMRRLGLAKKPTIIVQRSTYKQFVREIKSQYPNAKVLAPSAKDLTAKQREQLFAKIAYNDWDIVVLYHSYLDSIPDDPQRVAQYIDEKIDEKMDLLAEMERAKEDGAANAGRMMGALKKEIEKLERDRNNTLNPEIEEESDTPTKSKRKRSVKDIEKVRSNAEAKAEKSLDRRTDNTMSFEQLGIDALLIDEAHAYKKLGFVTSLQRVKGIDTAESKRAQSTKLKTSYILDNHNGKNIVLATGTPISNTMAEMWTFMRYLYPRTEMGRLQMNNFDGFVNNFGSIEESAEFGSNGKFRITNRFSSYSNVPELIAAWRQVAHTVLTEEVSTLKEGVGTPRVESGKPADIMLEQTPPLKSVMKAIKNKLEEFDRMSGAEKKENSYIPLVMFGLAKRAAIDVRLVDPNLPDHPESKLNKTVAEVIQDLKYTQSYKGTVAIFCDSYQSSDKSFNVFREIKQKLIDNGIPAEQVAIIKDFDKDEAKEKLFTAVNSGEVRVVMGTTEKLGVGVNIQERLHMAVHMDAPLRPSDYQQRNGRIMRQGNTHLNMDKTIKILRVGVQKTLDVTGYQRLEIKKKFIDQIMKGDVSQRMLEEADIESTDSSNFNQMMANLSGSQAALALSIEQNKLKKLFNAKQYHEDNQVFMAGAVRRAKGVIVGNGQAIERFERYRKELQKLVPEGKVTTVSIGKLSADTPEDINALLSKHITKRIEKEVVELREDFLRENSIIKTSMSVNGIKIDLEIEVKRNYDIDTHKTRITREIHYTTPNNTIENPFSSENKVVPLFDGKAGANVQNVIDEINDLLSGYDIDKQIQKYKLGIDKSQRDIDAYEPQIGQSFGKESELKATEQKVDDLNAQMEVELLQIEAEEAKEDVEAIDIDDIVDKNTEDPEDDPTPPSGGRRQTSSSGNFQNIPAEKLDGLVDKLNQTGLATDVIIEDNINGNRAVQDSEGNVYGYVTPDGVVHLDAQNMNANTPIHEFGHLWNSFTKENDTALYNRGVELIKQSPYWERVNNNTDYSSLSEEQKADEALAMAIGDKGEAITNRSLKQQFIDWLSDVWQSIKQAFGINTNVSLADMTLSDFTDRAVQDLLKGEKLTDSPIQSEENRMQSVNDLAEATNSTMSEEVRNQLDKRIKNFRFRIREAWEDRHLAVKEFQDILRKNGVEIAEYNDYYKQATHINGKIDAQLEHYNNAFQKTLNKSISDLEKVGFDYRAIENYAILKHGIERNAWMRQDAINQYKEKNPEATQEQIDVFESRLPDDYSGITAVQEEVGMSAEEFIAGFENKADKKLIDNFWKRVKGATQFSISKQLEGGLIDKKTFDELTSRYDYYIPLRGHDAEVAEDRWDYSPNMGTYFVAPLIKAKGRKTRSESPFAYVFSMAQSAINSSNRNWLNQTMLRLARKDTTGLMGVSQSWYVMDGMSAEGVPTYKVESPTFSENAEQYRKNIEEFEERMQKLAEQGFAYPSGSKLDIGGMFIKRDQADQHEVHVWQNGKEYTVYINANPAVARAINGVNAKDLHKDLRFIAKVSRQMAANFTTRNPIFVATNFSRDYIFASSILGVKEDAKYAIQFQRNIPRSAGALQRYIRGKADLTKKQDQYVIEYIMNGAKTGFSHILELNNIQKRIEREIKNGDKTNALRATIDFLESCNEFAENLSRLSVYITSREQGRSITQSISDAKEVTVNFNRSGAGGYGAAWFRSLYLFVNAGIQALSNFAKVAQKNKGKVAILISSYAMTGFLMPMLTALVGGDDGLDEYMKLGAWERQNNLCLYTGSGFIKIPLPHELRVFHKMGDNIYQAAFGRKDVTQSIKDVILGFDDLIPTSPMGAVDDMSWSNSMLVPDALKPLAQLAENKNFTGGKITKDFQDKNKPGYLKIRTNKKGDPYAPAFMVKLAESLDTITGGDGVEKGFVSFNPDEVTHLLRGYFGGLYTIGMQVATVGDKLYDVADTGEFKLKVRETPLSTFYTSADDLMTTSSGLNSKYFKIADDMQEVQRKVKGYQEQVKQGDLTTEKFATKIGSFASDIEKHKRIYPYMKQIKKYESALKDLDGEDQKEAERIIADMKKKVIEINSISK